MLFIGLDLAWRDGGEVRTSLASRANETGVCVLDENGRVVDAGWNRGLDSLVGRLDPHLTHSDGVVLAVDAPLVVHNPPKTMRQCEREVGRQYGRWGFSAYPSHSALPWLTGVALRERLEERGVDYTTGAQPPGPGRSVAFECYPSTTLVGAHELGYPTGKPRYKTVDPRLSRQEGVTRRGEILDEIVGRLAALTDADPPMHLSTHPETASLATSGSPREPAAFKHREDLVDAVICAWTAAFWHRWGTERCQILGLGSPPDARGRVATIVAPARPEQRVSSSSPPPSRPS